MADAAAADTLRCRIENAALGIIAGDAIAMPLHWYYDYSVLCAHVSDYYSAGGARLDMYHAVHPDLKYQHPSSWKYFSQVGWGMLMCLTHDCPVFLQIDVRAEPMDIFHGKAECYGMEGCHYHHDIPAGDNTVTAHLARLVMSHLAARPDGRCDALSLMAAYERFFLEATQHNDTYLEAIHRGFFRERAAGGALLECGKLAESCLSILTWSLPVLLARLADGDSLDSAHTAAVAHASFVSQSPLVVQRLRVLTWLFNALLRRDDAGPAADVVLAQAFAVLMAELGTGPTDIEALNKTVQTDDDVTALFWGADRMAQGLSEVSAIFL